MTKAKSVKKTVKAERNSRKSFSLTDHHCEQWNLHKHKNKCHVPHITTKSAQKMEWLQTDCEFANSTVAKTDKKPLTSTENIQNVKAKRDVCTAGARVLNYAGAKFSEPPAASLLPKPPSHWMDVTIKHSDQCKDLMTHHLKTLLKVHPSPI